MLQWRWPPQANWNCLDCKCPHNNSCDWFWSPFFSMGYSSAWMDCWSSSHVLVLLCNLLHFITSS
ncbi:unnamed protein product, partial [Vitis vinifera]|uniref:Uncharacterized protein n=1 Tax=Vitis vinifera TaxID=29760 RepID=D7UDU3_VITVI